jgi:uracil-DNA glycosylase
MASCPGRLEQRAGRPLAGASGRNLRAALASLRERFGPVWFPSLVLEDYTLTNAWDRVEYPELTGRSEATPAEVLAEENVAAARARIERAGATRIVALGDRARGVARRVGVLAVIAGPHPSPLLVNTRYYSGRASAKARTLHRLEQWAAQLDEVAT